MGLVLLTVIVLRLLVCKKKRHVYSTVHHDGGKLSQPGSRIVLQEVAVTPTPAAYDKVSWLVI